MDYRRRRWRNPKKEGGTEDVRYDNFSLVPTDRDECWNVTEGTVSLVFDFRKVTGGGVDVPDGTTVESLEGRGNEGEETRSMCPEAGYQEVRVWRRLRKGGVPVLCTSRETSCKGVYGRTG